MRRRLDKPDEVTDDATFEDLLVEASAAPVEGWEFSWLEGRAREERPSWGYARMMGGRMAEAAVALDIQTGGGEVLAEIRRAPPVLVATESFRPNLDLARRRLATLGASVVHAAEHAGLPFRRGSFDLVVSRHPTVTVWDEIGRVLAPGGTYLSQQVGAGSLRELYEFLMGPRPAGDARTTATAVAAAEAAGLEVVDLRQETLRTEFDDIGAVVYFLRKVIWVVPGFTVDAYRPRLARLHQRIQDEGPFVAFAQRFLIEARKPR